MKQFYSEIDYFLSLWSFCAASRCFCLERRCGQLAFCCDEELTGQTRNTVFNQISSDSQSDPPDNQKAEVPLADSSSISTSSNESKKVTRQDIKLVQNLMESCLQLYMNKDEAVKTLLTWARIDPGFTTLVNNLPMGYPVLQQPPMPAPGQSHLNPMRCGISICHVVNGVPAPSCYHHPTHANLGNNVLMDTTTADATPAIPPSSAMSPMSEMSVSPASVVSSTHFPFSGPEMSRVEMDPSALDTAFTSDVASSVGLQLVHDAGPGNSRDSLRSLDQIQWNFSLSDLTADLSNLGDLGALGNYPSSPFLLSDSDILLESPEQEDIVEEFFVDPVPGPPNSEPDE